MIYTEMTDEQKERAFAEDVLKWKRLYISLWIVKIDRYLRFKDFHPLTELNHAMLGVEKLIKDKRIDEFDLSIDLVNSRAEMYDNSGELMIESIEDTPNEAIVEACLKITSPELFEEDDR